MNEKDFPILTNPEYGISITITYLYTMTVVNNSSMESVLSCKICENFKYRKIK